MEDQNRRPIVVATKRKVDLLFDLYLADGFGVMGTPKMAVTELARKLSQIPIYERAEATAMYPISSKNRP